MVSAIDYLCWVLDGHESCSDAASMQSSRSSSVGEMVKINNHCSNIENQEVIYLKKALDEKDKTYRDVVQKLQTLVNIVMSFFGFKSIIFLANSLCRTSYCL